MGPTERLATLAREALAAGQGQSADRFAAFVQQRAPDLANEARAMGDLAARGLVGPLDNDAVAPHEDAPIAADLAARLGVPLAAAQTAITAARLLSEGGRPAAAGYAPAAAAPSAQKPIWQQPIALAGAAVAAGLLYYAMKPDPAPPPPPPVPGYTGVTPALNGPTVGPTAGPTVAPPDTSSGQQGNDGGLPMLTASEDPSQAPLVRPAGDPQNGRVGGHFRFDLGNGPIEAIVFWPQGGPASGNGEVLMSRPGGRLEGRDNAAYRATGPFEPRRTEQGQTMYVFKPGEEVSDNSMPRLTVIVALGASENLRRRGAAGAVIVGHEPSDRAFFGLIPAGN